jgi:addiction module HigA family antidote
MSPIINRMRPIHPGEILNEEFLKPLEMSCSALAERLGVPPNRISSIVAGERAITADTALRLAAAFGTTPLFWLNLQKSYELRVEELDKDRAAERRGIRRLTA